MKVGVFWDVPKGGFETSHGEGSTSAGDRAGKSGRARGFSLRVLRKPSKSRSKGAAFFSSHRSCLALALDFRVVSVLLMGSSPVNSRLFTTVQIRRLLPDCPRRGERFAVLFLRQVGGEFSTCMVRWFLPHVLSLCECRASVR